jgi:hypothetical protein
MAVACVSLYSLVDNLHALKKLGVLHFAALGQKYGACDFELMTGLFGVEFL